MTNERPEYQTRVIAEKDSLDEKLGKLAIFINRAMFLQLNTREQGRLVAQHVFMSAYSTILGERIRAFDDNKGDDK